MMRENKLSIWPMFYSVVIGLGELATGALMLASPSLVCSLLHLNSNDADWHLRWLGVWVGTVGILYLWAAHRLFWNQDRPLLRHVWQVTAILRSATAVFLLVSLILGQGAFSWLQVAGYDALLAVVQVVWLCRLKRNE